MPLSDLQCRQAKPQPKNYRLFDGGGLYLDVRTAGSRTWRLKYKFFGKEKLLTIGPYPSISLLEARTKREQAKILLRNGTDPAREKQEAKRLAHYRQAQTFQLVAEEWFAQNLPTWSKNYADNIRNRLRADVYPALGSAPVGTLTVQEVLACLRKVEARGCHDLAHRILQVFRQIMRYAVVTGRAERDVTAELKGALSRYRKGHFASIDGDQLPNLVRAIDTNEARLFKQTTIALKLIMLTFVRTSELINARWEEFDLASALWTIPAERMKTRIAHQVPLSRQVLALLHELRETYGGTGYILPSVVRRGKPISNNTILKALDRLGYGKKMTGHGFRALALSSIKEKLHYRHEVVDRQLAHLPRTQVDQAYDRANFLTERKKMMQDWADYIDAVSSRTPTANILFRSDAHSTSPAHGTTPRMPILPVAIEYHWSSKQ
jgi:integrase